MRLEQARLQSDDVLSQLEVLLLYRLVVLRQRLVLLDLVFQRLDVLLLPLAEGALGGAVLGGSLGRRQLAPSLARLGAVVVDVHVMKRNRLTRSAANGWIYVVVVAGRGVADVHVLRRRRTRRSRN